MTSLKIPIHAPKFNSQNPMLCNGSNTPMKVCLPVLASAPHLIHGTFMGLLDSASQTESRSVQPFSHDSR